MFTNCIFTRLTPLGLIAPNSLDDTKCHCPSLGIFPELIVLNTFDGLLASTILICILGSSNFLGKALGPFAFCI